MYRHFNFSFYFTALGMKNIRNFAFLLGEIKINYIKNFFIL